MRKLFHNTIVILFGNTLGARAQYLNIIPKRRAEQLLDLLIIIIVIVDPEQRVNIIPNGAPKQTRIDLFVRAHGIIRHITGDLEVPVQELAYIRVNIISRHKALTVPSIILELERLVRVFKVEPSAIGIVGVLQHVLVRLGHDRARIESR